MHTQLMRSPVQLCSTISAAAAAAAAAADSCLSAARGSQCSKVTQCYCLLLREPPPAESQLTKGAEQKI